MKPVIATTDRGVLIVCMAISFLLWLGNTLSDTHTSARLPVQLQYDHLPTDLVPTHSLPSQVLLTIEANGVDILRQNWQQHRLVIDYDDYKNSSKISTDNFRLLLREQLPNAKILDIAPDTLYFSFQKKYRKKIPIQIVADITPASRFAIKNISIQPDSIGISGSHAAIDSILFWKTETLSARDLTEDLMGNIALLPANMNNVSVDSSLIKYQVVVEEFTEKKLNNIAIITQNIPANKSVFLYPPQVSLQFQVSVGEFEYINESNFEIVADFKQIDWTNDKTVALQITQQPLNIKNVKIIPRPYAEFIIMNK